MKECNMKVPLFDMKRIIKPYKSELVKSLEENIDSSQFIMGKSVLEFEKRFADKTGSKYAVGVSNGTDAILATILALDLPIGSEIIVPSYTFISSASTILHAGCKPVFVDIDKNSFHPSVYNIKKLCNQNTKAIIFVHLFGEYLDLSELKQFCEDSKIYLIEDCAQAYGAADMTQGIASTFSFFPAKNLGCLGDGGAICTDDKKLYEKIKKIRVHGTKAKYLYEELGGNYRLDTIQAGFLNVLLDYSDEWVKRRQDNAEYYNNKLSGLKWLSLPSKAKKHSYNQYTLRTEYRDELYNYLKSLNIGCAVYYPYPLHTNKIFTNDKELNETSKRCLEVLSIPIYPGLTDDEREYVSQKILEFK
jgi:dTDP-4-amino-4,6-dideoxygalactose transaminase